MAEEQRQLPRIEVRLVTWVKVVDTGKVQRALTRNLGSIGLCVTTEGAHSPGTLLEIELHLPDRSAPIICKAKVVWSTPHAAPRKSFDASVADTEVEFTDIHPQDRAAILQYIRLNALPPASPSA